MGDRLATIDIGRKLGERLCPVVGGGGFPCNTKLRGPRPTSIPSGILIYPAFGRNEYGLKIGTVPLFEGGG